MLQAMSIQRRSSDKSSHAGNSSSALNSPHSDEALSVEGGEAVATVNGPDIVSFRTLLRALEAAHEAEVAAARAAGRAQARGSIAEDDRPPSGQSTYSSEDERFEKATHVKPFSMGAMPILGPGVNLGGGGGSVFGCAPQKLGKSPKEQNSEALSKKHRLSMSCLKPHLSASFGSFGGPASAGLGSGRPSEFFSWHPPRASAWADTKDSGAHDMPMLHSVVPMSAESDDGKLMVLDDSHAAQDTEGEGEASSTPTLPAGQPEVGAVPGQPALLETDQKYSKRCSKQVKPRVGSLASRASAAAAAAIRASHASGRKDNYHSDGPGRLSERSTFAGGGEGPAAASTRTTVQLEDTSQRPSKNKRTLSSVPARWELIVGQVIAQIAACFEDLHDAWNQSDNAVMTVRAFHPYVDIWKPTRDSMDEVSGRSRSGSFGLRRFTAGTKGNSRVSAIARTDDFDVEWELESENSDQEEDEVKKPPSRFQRWRRRVRHDVIMCCRLARRRWREKGIGILIMEPHCTARIIWSVMAVMLMVYDIIVVPLQVYDLDEDGFLLFMSWVNQLFWTADICINFLTAVYVNGEVSRNLLVIASQYGKSWLGFDLLVVVPMWPILAGGEESGLLKHLKLLKYIRFVRFVRLLRLAKLERMLDEALAGINSPSLLLVVKMIKLMCCLILINHLNACLWYAVGDHSLGWVQNYEGKSGFARYLISMHWALTQFQGTSEISPGDLTGERLYAVMTVLVSLLLMSTFVSSLTNMMMQLQALHAQKTNERRMVQMYLSQNGISTGLSGRVKSFLAFKHAIQSMLDTDQEVLKILPDQLTMDLHDEVRRPAFISHHFFHAFQNVYPRLTRKICHGALNPLMRFPEEVVFMLQERCTSMYFVMSGELTYTAQTRHETEVIKVFSVPVVRSHHLSEAALWLPWEHRGELVVTSFASLLSLNQDDFISIVCTHPPAQVSCVLYARRVIFGLLRGGYNMTDITSLKTIMFKEDKDRRGISDFLSDDSGEQDPLPPPATTQAVPGHAMCI